MQTAVTYVRRMESFFFKIMDMLDMCTLAIVQNLPSDPTNGDSINLLLQNETHVHENFRTRQLRKALFVNVAKVIIQGMCPKKIAKEGWAAEMFRK